MKKRDILWYFLIIGTILFCFRSFFLPGLVWKDDYVPLNPKFIYYTFFTWNPEEHAGTINEHLPSCIINAIYCLFASFSGTAIAAKVYVVTVVNLVALCMFCATNKLQLWYRGFSNKTISVFCSLFYAINPWTTSRVLSGHFPLLTAYAIAPLFIIYCLRSLNTYEKAYIIKTIALLSIIGMVSFHGFVLVSISFFIIVCWAIAINKTVACSLGVFSCIIAVSVLLIFFWVFPNIYILTSGEKKFPQVTAEPYFLSENSKPLNVLRLMGYFWVPYDRDIYLMDSAINPIWLLLSFIFPFLVSLSVFFMKSRYDIRIPFMLLFIVSITLSQGTSLLGELYVHLVNLPFLQVLRDPNKIVFITCFSSCLVLGLSLEDFSLALKKICSKILENAVGMKARSSPQILQFISCFLIISILILNFPWVTGDFKGFYSPQEVPLAYQYADEFLKNQEGDFRVLYLPIYSGCISFDWGGGVNEPVRYLSSKPVLNPPYSPTYELSPYTTLFMNYISSALWNNSTRRIGALLGLANVKYVVARADVLPLSASEVFLDALSRQKDLALIWNYGNVYIFENKVWLPKMRIASTGVTVIGGFKSLEKLPYIGMDFSKKVFFFPEIDSRIPTNTPIFINFDNFLDYLLSFSPKESKINLRDYVNGETWILDSWLQTLSEDLCEDGACIRALSDESTNISFTVKEAGKYQLFLKIFGEASILIDGKDINDNTTIYYRPGFHWLRCNLTLENGGHFLSISKSGEHLGLDKALLIAERDFTKVQNEAYRDIKVHSFILHVEAESLYSYGGEYLDGFLSNLDFSGRFAISLKEGDHANLPAHEYVTIPEGKKCYMNLQAAVLNYLHGNISVIFRNLENGKERIFNLEIEGQEKNLFRVELENLEPGDYFLVIRGNDVILDFFDIYDFESTSLFGKEETDSLIKYERKNPTEYYIEIEHEPEVFFVAISESYTNLWSLYANGKKLDPLHSDIFSMAFIINATKITQMTLSFSPQYYSNIGWVISLSTFFACTAYLVYSHPKTRNILHKLKNKKPRG